MSRERYASQYAEMAPEQLILLQSEGGLLPEAQEALLAEIDRREISTSEITNCLDSYAEATKADEESRELVIGFGVRIAARFLFGRF